MTCPDEADLTNYAQIQALTDYPAAFPPDLTDVTAGDICAATYAQGALADSAVQTVNGDVKRIYNADTTPPDGVQPGDVVLSVSHSPQGPGALPGLKTWLDASATGARSLGSVLPDVSGNGIDFDRRDNTSIASVSSLNGLPAFRFEDSAYWNPGASSGTRTLSGVFAFTGGIPNADQSFMFTGGDLALDLAARGSTGRLYLTIEGVTLYHLPMSWSADGKAYVSFVISLGTHPYLYLNGEMVTSASPSPLSTDGDRGSLVLSRMAEPFVGVLGEFAEHEGHAASATEAAALAAYYGQKWRV